MRFAIWGALVLEVELTASHYIQTISRGSTLAAQAYNILACLGGVSIRARMSFRHSIFLAFNLLIFVAPVFGSKKDAESDALIARAQRLSDFRAEGAPGFRLKVDFKTVNDNGLATMGTYEEVWVSRSQWRRETVLGSFRRIQVAVGRKLWTVDSAADAPEWTNDVSSLSDVGRLHRMPWKPRKILDREVGGIKARCIETEFGPAVRGSVLCLDQASGTLLTETSSLKIGSRIVDRTCFYEDFKPFGERLIARSYRCEERNQIRFEARIAELAFEKEPAPSLFTAPDGAKESVHCIGPVQHPTIVHQVDPMPLPIPTSHNQVVLNIAVGTDGIPHNIRITSSASREFDHAAVEAMRQWRFRPAQCDGEPTEVEIAVEMNFP